MLIQWGCVGVGDLYFLEYWEFDFIGQCVEFLDLCFIFWFLVFEVVGWEIEY